jgi:hypothetical protein
MQFKLQANGPLILFFEVNSPIPKNCWIPNYMDLLFPGNFFACQPVVGPPVDIMHALGRIPTFFPILENREYSVGTTISVKNNCHQTARIIVA